MLLQLADWYRVPRKDFSHYQRGRALLSFYPSLQAALQELYPEFAWDSTQFIESPRAKRGYWFNQRKLREFVDKIGGELGVQQVRTLLRGVRFNYQLILVI